MDWDASNTAVEPTPMDIERFSVPPEVSAGLLTGGVRDDFD